MLTAVDLDWMRSEQAGWLSGTATIQTRVPVSDGAGGFDPGWAASGTVACRVATTGGGETLLGDALRDAARWVVTLPHDADVATGDRLITDGRVLEVVAVAAQTTIQTATRCQCVEVR